MQFIPKLNIDFTKLVTILFFILILLIGLFIYKDYGLTTDEPTERYNAIINLKYVLTKILGESYASTIIPDYNNLPLLRNHIERDHGVVLFLPAYIIELLFSKNNIIIGYQLSHLLIFIYIYIGLICLYFAIKKIFQSRLLAISAIILYLLSPRFFAESFFNGKDIIVVAFAFVNFYTLSRVITDNSIKNIFLHAIATGLIIDTRIIGIVYFATTLGIIFFKGITTKKYKNIIKIIIEYLLLSLFFIIAFFPYFWSHPFQHILEVFSNMSNFNRHDGYNLLNGNFYHEHNLPWWYASAWIGITIPLSILGLFIFGTILYTIKIIKKATKNKFRISFDNQELFILYAFIILFGSQLSIILFKSSIYNGWRHLYFFYPEIIILAIFGLYSIIKTNKIKIISKLCLALCTFDLIFSLFFIINNHPYQNVYFNILASKPWSKNHEIDYWSNATHLAFEFLLKQEKGDILYCNKSWISPYTSRALLNNSDNVRLKEVPCEIAQYFVNNFYCGSADQSQYLNNLEGNRIYNLSANKQTFLEVRQVANNLTKKLDNLKILDLPDQIIQNDNFVTTIDNCNFFDINNKESIRLFEINGWFYNKDIVTQNYQRVIILKNKNNIDVFRVIDVWRPDVATYFKDQSLNMSGYRSYINASKYNNSWSIHVGILTDKCLYISKALQDILFK